MIKKIAFITLAILISSCSKDQSPKGALKSFIKLRFQSGTSRGELLDRSTGQLYSTIEDLNQDDLDKFLDLKNFKLKNFKVLSRRCTEVKCVINYLISYSETKSQTTVVTEVKKSAILVREEDSWKLSDVTNIKTYHDSQTPLQVN